MREDEIGQHVRAAVDALRKQMERRSRGTESTECYQLVANGKDYRLGMAAEEPDALLSVELLVRVLREDAELDVAVLARILRMAEALQDRGYALAHQGDGWVSCDTSVAWSDAARECRTLLGLLDENGFGRSKEDNLNLEV